jgi:hypothetical protein
MLVVVKKEASQVNSTIATVERLGTILIHARKIQKKILHLIQVRCT